MKQKTCLAMLLLFLVIHAISAQSRVKISTPYGDVLVVIDTMNAPVTGRNFLNLTKIGAFASGASFYRVVRMDNQADNPVKIQVIQGGLRVDSLIEKYPSILHETTAKSGLKHLDGTISMARLEPGSASTEFFICLGDQPELDFGGKRNPDGQGFAAFGRVVEGMPVIRKIHMLEQKGQLLVPNVKIAISIIRE